MGRRRGCRRVGHVPGVRVFQPYGVPMGALRGVVIAADDLEAMRLVDGLGLTQEEAATHLGVSKATVCRMVGVARAQVVRALTNGMAIRIVDADATWATESAAPLGLEKKSGCCQRRDVCLAMDDLGKAAADAVAEADRADRDVGFAAGMAHAATVDEEVVAPGAQGRGSRSPQES